MLSVPPMVTMMTPMPTTTTPLSHSLSPHAPRACHALLGAPRPLGGRVGGPAHALGRARGLGGLDQLAEDAQAGAEVGGEGVVADQAERGEAEDAGGL